MKTFVEFLKRFWKLLKERRIELKEKGGGSRFWERRIERTFRFGE